MKVYFVHRGFTTLPGGGQRLQKTLLSTSKRRLKKLGHKPQLLQTKGNHRVYANWWFSPLFSEWV